MKPLVPATRAVWIGALTPASWQQLLHRELSSSYKVGLSWVSVETFRDNTCVLRPGAAASKGKEKSPALVLVPGLSGKGKEEELQRCSTASEEIAKAGKILDNAKAQKKQIALFL